MYEISLKYQHNCEYTQISELFDGECYSYCSDYYDLMIIPQTLSESDVEQIKPHIIDLDSLEIIQSSDNNATTFLYFKCMCNLSSSISPKLQQRGGIVEQPVRYANGWEYYKITCLNEKTQASLLRFIQTLDKYELLSIRDLGRDGLFKSQFISIHQLVQSMTDRQVEVIVKAYENGYYDIPRYVTTKELADSFDVSRPATEKSLRKAENAIMDAVMPYLFFQKQLSAKSSEDNRLKLKL